MEDYRGSKVTRKAAASVVGIAALLLASRQTLATEQIEGGRGEVSARFSVQNAFQHNNAKSVQWVQERNEIRLDLGYNLIKPGDVIAGLKQLKFSMLYRGRYDGVYQAREAYRDRNYDRGDFMFPEGKYPREIFLDIGFAGPLKNLSARIGRQQVVWGESDLFRSIDVVNPLRIDQSGFVGEDFADFREPLWIAKFLYHIGHVGKYLDEAGLEFFYSPNSRPQQDRPWLQFGETWKLHIDQHNVVDGFDRNLVLPFRQVRAPWEISRVGARYTDAPAVVQNADGTFSDFAYQINNEVPSDVFSVKDASMVGVRFLGTTIGNTYFTINYLFKRADSAGSSVIFGDLFDRTQPGTGALRGDVLAEAVNAIGTPDLDGDGIPDGVEEQFRSCKRKERGQLMIDDGNPATSWDGSIYSDPRSPQLHTGANNASFEPVLPVAGDGLSHSTGCLQIPLWHPWTHIVGFTSTYNDYEYTGLVFRLEQSWSSKEARNGNSPNSPARLAEQKAGGRIAVPQKSDFDNNNMRVTQVWRSMVGFDYLRTLFPEAGRRLPQPFRSLATDQWFFTVQFLNEYYAHSENVNLNTSFTNRMSRWNPLVTAAATGFFLHQTLRPTLAVAVDTNQMYPLFFMQAQYYLTEKLELRVGEIIYAGSKNDETNSALHFYSDRDTFYARLTYFLL